MIDFLKQMIVQNPLLLTLAILSFVTAKLSKQR